MNLFLQELSLFEQEKEFSAETLQDRYEGVLNAIIDTALAYRKNVYITTEVLQQEAGIAKQYAKIPQGLAFRVLYPPPSGLPELSLPLLNTSFDPLIASIGK